MNNFIPEKIYKIFLENMPIFCIDFLYECKNEYLLLKRVEEPLKDIFWLPGGRLRLNETIADCALRIQERETGKFIKDYQLVGFSNYFFEISQNARAIHTPTLLFKIKIEKKFVPILDNSHSAYIWTKKLPKKFTTNLINFEKDINYF